MKHYNVTKKIEKRLHNYRPGYYCHEIRKPLPEGLHLPPDAVIKVCVRRPALSEERMNETREQRLHQSVSFVANFKFNVGGMTWDEVFKNHNFNLQLPPSFDNWSPAFIEADIDLDWSNRREVAVARMAQLAAACGKEEER